MPTELASRRVSADVDGGGDTGGGGRGREAKLAHGRRPLLQREPIPLRALKEARIALVHAHADRAMLEREGEPEGRLYTPLVPSPGPPQSAPISPVVSHLEMQ